MTLKFFDCVQNRGIASFADNYFELPLVTKAMGYRTFRVMNEKNILEEVKKDQNPLLTFLLTVLKVASYVTVVLPLIILAIKATFRAQLLKELKNPSEVKKDPPKEVPPTLKKLGPSLLNMLDVSSEKKDEFVKREFSSLQAFNTAVLVLLKEKLKADDKLTLNDLINGDIASLVTFATFATSLPTPEDAKEAQPLLEDILRQFIDILLPRLKKFETIDISKELNSLQQSAPSGSLFSPVDGLMLGLKMVESAVKDMAKHLHSPVKEHILNYIEETTRVITQLSGSIKTHPTPHLPSLPKSDDISQKKSEQEAPSKNTVSEKPLEQPKVITKVLGAPKKINQVTSGQELKKILTDPEIIKNGYRVDIQVSQQAVIDYLKEGGKPELVGTFFYCLDLRDPVLEEHAEAIVRHATRLVEIQGLNGKNAPVLIPLLGKCENLKHLHLELEWGVKDVDLSPLSHHQFGLFEIVGEGVSETTLKSLKGASIQKLRLPSDLPLLTLEFMVHNLRPKNVSFWKHFAGAKADKLLNSYGLNNLMWNHGIVTMDSTPENRTISPYLDPNLDEESPKPTKQRACQTITANQGKELKKALEDHNGNELVITTTENAVINYLFEGGDPAKVANFFKCLDLRKPTLAKYAERLIPHASRLVEIQGLKATNAPKLMPLLAKHCPKLRHFHLDIQSNDPVPNFDLFKWRDLGCLTILGSGGQKVMEKLRGFNIDALYIPVIYKEAETHFVMDLKPGKIVFWNGFVDDKIEELLKNKGYRNLCWRYDVGAADDYEKNKEIILRGQN